MGLLSRLFGRWERRPLIDDPARQARLRQELRAVLDDEVRTLVAREIITADQRHEVFETALRLAFELHLSRNTTRLDAPGFYREIALRAVAHRMVTDVDWGVPPKLAETRARSRAYRRQTEHELLAAERCRLAERERAAEAARDPEVGQEMELRRLANPDAPADGDHEAQLRLGLLLARRGDMEGADYWLGWAETGGYLPHHAAALGC